MTWCLTAKHLKQLGHVVAFDARCHGQTRAHGEKNMSLEELTADAFNVLVEVVGSVAGELPSEKKKRQIFLVGHSMGGAVATALAAYVADKEKEAKISFRIVGCAMLDMVGDTALRAMRSTERFLKFRPTQFPSKEAAVDWSCKCGYVKNRSSARLSVPSCLIKSTSSESFTWRTDLLETKKFWPGWFKKLSVKFLSLRVSKLLVISETCKLDTAMTIAQMQGKYMLKVIRAGHMIHENAPEATAETILAFARRVLKVSRLVS
eukprot:g503.t1